jgi:hypothetical protein
LHDFRARLIATDMDRRLLERTVEIARKTEAFDWKKLPKSLRVAMDSSPLEGQGRVEDTINLLAHAARNVVKCAAKLLGRSPEDVALEAGIPLLNGEQREEGPRHRVGRSRREGGSHQHVGATGGILGGVGSRATP